jgi:hypothetical protein
MVANGGYRARAVREAKNLKTGKKIYSDAYAKSDKIVKTKSWKILLESELPDAKLLAKHKSLLDAKNENVQLGAVKLGYEVKNKIQPEQPKPSNIQINLINNPRILKVMGENAKRIIEAMYDEKTPKIEKPLVIKQ